MEEKKKKKKRRKESLEEEAVDEDVVEELILSSDEDEDVPSVGPDVEDVPVAPKQRSKKSNQSLEPSKRKAQFHAKRSKKRMKAK